MLSFTEKCRLVSEAACEMDSSKAVCLDDAVRLFQTGQEADAGRRLEKAAKYAWGFKRPAGWYDMRALPVRFVSIVCKDHPEWGSFGIMEDKGSFYEIGNSRGGRVLDKEEAAQFWAIAD